MTELAEPQSSTSDDPDDRGRGRSSRATRRAGRARRCCRCCTWCSRTRATSRRPASSSAPSCSGSPRPRSARWRPSTPCTSAGPTGDWLVSVCTNTMCDVLGGAGGLRHAHRAPRASGTTRPPPTARSRWSTPSAWPPATTARCMTVNYDFFDKVDARVGASDMVERAAGGRAAAADAAAPGCARSRRCRCSWPGSPTTARGRGRRRRGRASRRCAALRLAQQHGIAVAGFDPNTPIGDAAGGAGRPGRKPASDRKPAGDGDAAGAARRPQRAVRRRWRSSPRCSPSAGCRPDAWRHDDLRAARRLRGAAQGAQGPPRRPDPAHQGLGPARPRRRRLPHRPEVGLHPAERRQAALPRGQRRRGRAGHLQGPAADDARPALADRGRHHRVVRDPGQPRVHLHPRRGGARRPAAAQRGRRGVRQAGYLGTNILRLRLRPGPGRPQRSGRVHLRRGDGAARLAGGLPRPAAAAPAVPGHARPLRLPDRGQQRRHHRQRAVHRARRRRLVEDHGHGEVVRPDDLLAVRADRQPRPVRVLDGHHAARADRAGRRHAARARAASSGRRAARRPRC